MILKRFVAEVAGYRGDHVRQHPVNGRRFNLVSERDSELPELAQTSPNPLGSLVAGERVGKVAAK